jgi:hypothetical protein
MCCECYSNGNNIGLGDALRLLIKKGKWTGRSDVDHVLQEYEIPQLVKVLYAQIQEEDGIWDSSLLIDICHFVHITAAGSNFSAEFYLLSDFPTEIFLALEKLPLSCHSFCLDYFFNLIYADTFRIDIVDTLDLIFRELVIPDSSIRLSAMDLLAQISRFCDNLTHATMKVLIAAFSKCLGSSDMSKIWRPAVDGLRSLIEKNPSLIEPHFQDINVAIFRAMEFEDDNTIISGLWLLAAFCNMASPHLVRLLLEYVNLKLLSSFLSRKGGLQAVSVDVLGEIVQNAPVEYLKAMYRMNVFADLIIFGEIAEFNVKIPIVFVLVKALERVPRILAEHLIDVGALHFMMQAVECATPGVRVAGDVFRVVQKWGEVDEGMRERIRMRLDLSVLEVFECEDGEAMEVLRELICLLWGE